jgi:hypothetical protein
MLISGSEFFTKYIVVCYSKSTSYCELNRLKKWNFDFGQISCEPRLKLKFKDTLFPAYKLLSILTTARAAITTWIAEVVGGKNEWSVYPFPVKASCL